MRTRAEHSWRRRRARRFGAALLSFFFLSVSVLPRVALLVHEHADSVRGHVHVAPSAGSDVHHGHSHAHGHHGSDDHEHLGLAAGHHNELADAVVATAEASPRSDDAPEQPGREDSGSNGPTGPVVEAARLAHVHAHELYERSVGPELERVEVVRIALFAEIDPAVALLPSQSVRSRARGPPLVEIRI